jgi:hypothetical protein
VFDDLSFDPFALFDDGSFNALASRRRSLTSSVVAARAVSPASRHLQASMNSFDQV